MSYTWIAAERIANSADKQKVGIATPLLTILISTLLPKLLNCGADNDEINVSTTQARVRHLHERNARRLQRRVAVNTRRNDRTLSQAQAEEIARCVIQETLEARPDEVEAVAAECFDFVVTD